MEPATQRAHGGPDSHGVPAHDFSANGNACGPCPPVLAAVAAADATRYPDPAYARLREQLAALHRVPTRRVVLAGSGSEFIWRVTSWVRAKGGTRVWVPRHGYGEYGMAARALLLSFAAAPGEQADLAWACDPSSPLGEADHELSGLTSQHVVIDRAYEPLRLTGDAPPAALLDRCWQLWSPNKALGLTGIRGAYAIAPVQAGEALDGIEALAPSWPVGAHGVAMLQAWCDPAAQAWLAQSLHTLREWKARQLALCESLGWRVHAGTANFHTATLPVPSARGEPALSQVLAFLREHGIKLRDCTSFGLPGHLRLSVQRPASQDALARAWSLLP